MMQCRAGVACRDSRIVGGQRHPASIEDGALMCVGCQAALKIALRKMGADYYELGEVYDLRVSPGDPTVNMTPDPTIPINANVLALQDEIACWAEAALKLVAAKLPNAVPTRQKGRGHPIRNTAVINAATKVFRARHDLLIEAPMGAVRVWRDGGMYCQTVVMDGPQVAVKLICTHAKVKGLLGERNPRRRLAMPCPRFDCGMPTLGIDNGETDITCTSCGGRWTEAEYDWFTGMVIGTSDPKEIEMLRETIEELRTQLASEQESSAAMRETLMRIKGLADLPADELAAFDSATITAMLREILADVPVLVDAQKSPGTTTS